MEKTKVLQNLRKNFLRNESGQIIVFMVALIFFLGLFVALLLNFSVITLYKMKLQNAADGLAMAGAYVQAKYLNAIAEINRYIYLYHKAMWNLVWWDWGVGWYDWSGNTPYNTAWRLWWILKEQLQNVQENLIPNFYRIEILALFLNFHSENPGYLAFHLNNVLELGEFEWKKYNIPYMFLWGWTTCWGIPCPIFLPLWPVQTNYYYGWRYVDGEQEGYIGIIYRNMRMFRVKKKVPVIYFSVVVEGKEPIRSEEFIGDRLFKFGFRKMESVWLSGIPGAPLGMRAVAAAKPYRGYLWKGGWMSGDSKLYKAWLVKISDSRLKPRPWFSNVIKYEH
ncbi:MAG: Tad domain-containing protein [Acidobacteriota bacterium]